MLSTTSSLMLVRQHDHYTSTRRWRSWTTSRRRQPVPRHRCTVARLRSVARPCRPPAPLRQLQPRSVSSSTATTTKWRRRTAAAVYGPRWTRADRVTHGHCHLTTRPLLQQRSRLQSPAAARYTLSRRTTSHPTVRTRVVAFFVDVRRARTL